MVNEDRARTNDKKMKNENAKQSKGVEERSEKKTALITSWNSDG